MPLFNAYHDVDAATHQTNVNNLSAAGYHPISLSIYGDPASPRFAAIWMNDPWPLWLAIHSFTAAQYQDWITNSVEAGGFSLRLVSAVGDGGSALFAAVADKSGAGWSARHGLSDGDGSDPNSLQTYLEAQRQSGMIPLSVAAYGTPGGRLFAVASQPNVSSIQWAYPQRTTVDPGQWQNYFNAYSRIPSRPGHFAISADLQYFGIFRNDSLGPQITRHGLISSDYQSVFNQLTSQGYLPVCVAGGGSGSNTRFVATFARQADPLPRQSTVTGSPVTYLAALDTNVQDFMKNYGVRAGALAIVRHGKLVYSRGFTLAEGSHPATQTNTLFRIASCSKAFTCAAINKLVNARKLGLSDQVFPLLGISTAAIATQNPDPAIDTITVQNLLDHLGGWNDGGSSGIVYMKAGSGYMQVPSSGFDPEFSTREVAARLNLAGPPTKRDVARYMYGEPLQFPPGTTLYSKMPDGTYQVSGTGAYSNFGYMLLGLVVEQSSGMPYVDYLRQHVLAPLRLRNVYVSRMLAGQVSPLESFYDEPNVGPTPFDWQSNVLTPVVQGGEGLVTELSDSAGGLMTSAQTLARFAHTNAAWGIGGRNPGSARAGSEAGVSSFVESRWDDIDWACVFNTRWSLDRIAGTDTSGKNVNALEKLLGDIESILTSAAWP